MDDWDEWDSPYGFGLDDLDDWDADDHDDDWNESSDGDSAGAAFEETGAAGTERGVAGMSAWQFGTAAAVAGWLLDQQADRIAEAVRGSVARVPAEAFSAPGGSGGVRDYYRDHVPVAQRPRWTELIGMPIDWDAPPLRRGETLDRSSMAVTIALHLGARRQLALEARPVQATGALARFPQVRWQALSFSVALVDLVPQLPLWVMADIRPRGFSSEHLRAVFADSGPPGRAYCFVDTAEDAVNVVEWALDRYGIALRDFRWRQPPG